MGKAYGFMTICAVLILGVATVIAEDIRLVQDGKSEYSIYFSLQAPASVKTAAEELRHYIEKSSGVRLPIINAPRSPMIVLGCNAEAKKAGFDFANIPEDGFKMTSSGGNIYIFGKDDAEMRWIGYLSKGTLFGAYEFLERHIGIRWLMPGSDGEYIPENKNITLKIMLVESNPFFLSRSVHHIVSFNVDDRNLWNTRQKIGGFLFAHSHSWNNPKTFPWQTLREHPEYLALKDGKHDTLPADGGYWAGKFCTSNQGLINFAADCVEKKMSNNPPFLFVSISPTDGGGWCECPECSKLKESKQNPEWSGKDFAGFRTSVTPLILKFYNEVAKIVGKSHPNQYVCGYIYYDFLYPTENMQPLEPNVAIMLAPLVHYGMTRYKPENKAEFEKLCKAWGNASKFAGYYGASTWIRSGLGTPLGPSSEILEHTFNTLQKYNFKAVYHYILPWSYGGLHNYLVAKLMWNPKADIPALTRDYLECAYGGKAASYMHEIYRLLDIEMKNYKIKSPSVRADYEMTSDMAINIYAKNFWKIEELYKSALKSTKNASQVKRLELFGDEMTILNHVLCIAEALPEAQKSVFYLENEKYKDFLNRKKDSYAVKTMKDAGNEGGITGICVPGRKSMTIPRLKENSQPPLIDGNLDDTAWKYVRAAEQNQAVAQGFIKIGGQEIASAVTIAMAAYDEENLYISLRCKDNDIKGMIREKDDAGIFEDDCVEFFFSPLADSPNWYWHIALNPKNSKWDALTTNRSKMEVKENLCWESAVQEGEGFWSSEIKIPFKSLKSPTGEKDMKAPAANMIWRVNLTRQEKPSKENSSWAPVEKGFNENPDEFGTWNFSR